MGSRHPDAEGIRLGADLGDERDPESGTRRRLTQAERSALSETRMFNAAMLLISEQGANRTTLKEICEKAGYSRAHVNYRFGSKAAFLRALLMHFNRAWEIQLERFVGDRRGFEAILAAIDALEDFLQSHSRYMRGSYTIWYESIGGDNEVRDKLRENHHAYRRDLRRWTEQGIADDTIRSDANPDQFAVFYCSFVFGTIYQWLVNPDAISIERIFDYFRDVARQVLAADR